jgi:phosphoglycolate phosphatase
MTPTVLLFDVDGTLVTTAGVGRRALEQSFLATYGRTDMLRHVGLNGMTDRAIVRAGLAAIGVPSEGPEAETAIDAILAAYIPRLHAEIAVTPSFTVHRGVVATLAALRARTGVAVGLGTGNIRAGAEAKVGRAGILEHFRFGGYGCDHEDRGELLRIGAERGAAQLGTSIDACRVVVIGDTPRDVAAARAIGAESVGVGTSGFRAADLLASGATHAVDDLTDPRLLTMLLGR